MDFSKVFNESESLELKRIKEAQESGLSGSLGDSPEAKQVEQSEAIAFESIKQLARTFDKDPDIKRYIELYDKGRVKESKNNESGKEHLTEAKKGTFKGYAKMFSDAWRDVVKTRVHRIVAATLAIAVAAAAVGAAINKDKIIAAFKAKKAAQKGNFDGFTQNQDSVTDNSSSTEQSNTTTEQGNGNLDNTKVNDLGPVPKDPNPGAKPDEQSTQSNATKETKKNAVEQTQSTDNAQKTTQSTEQKTSGTKTNVADTLSTGAALGAGATIVKNANQNTNNVQSVDTNTNEVQKQSTETVDQNTTSEQDNTTEQASATETKNTSEPVDGTNAGQSEEANDTRAEQAEEQPGEPENGIDFSNPQNAWTQGLQKGGEVRNVKGGMGSGYLMHIPNTDQLVWSDKKNGGSQFEVYKSTDGGNTVIIGSVNYVWDGKNYVRDKNSAVLNEQGQALSLPQYIQYAAQKNNGPQDAAVQRYIQSNKGRGGAYVCGNYTWGGWYTDPNTKQQNFVVGSELYTLDGQRTNYKITSVKSGEALATDGQTIIYLTKGGQPAKDGFDLPIGQPLQMSQVIQGLIRKAKPNSGAQMGGILGATGYGALVGTAICPGLGTFIGSAAGLFGGALVAGSASTLRQKGVFGVIAWNTLDDTSKKLLIDHAADNFCFHTDASSDAEQQELQQKCNQAKQIFHQYGLQIAAAGNPRESDSIDTVIRNVGNGIAYAELGNKNNGNPYQTAAEQYVIQAQ